jgi:hypothetical protein
MQLSDLSDYATSQELVPFEALDAIRIAVAVIVILISGSAVSGGSDENTL